MSDEIEDYIERHLISLLFAQIQVKLLPLTKGANISS